MNTATGARALVQRGKGRARPTDDGPAVAPEPDRNDLLLLP